MTSKPRKNSRLAKLQERFPDRQLNRLISFTKKCPLGRSARVIYSLLMYRCKRQGKHVPASIKCLAVLSGMHRSTVAKALDELRCHYVVDVKDGLWGLKHLSTFTPLPNCHWYGWRQQHHSIKDLAYNWYLQPSETSPLTLTDALIYSADIQGRVSASCLAVRLCMDRKTVLRSRKKVRRLRFTLEWFADVRFKKKPPAPKTAKALLEGFEGVERRVVGLMLVSSPRWTQREIERFFEIARSHCPTDDAMFNAMLVLINPGPRSFEQSIREHRATGREGCGIGLVLRKMGWA